MIKSMTNKKKLGTYHKVSSSRTKKKRSTSKTQTVRKKIDDNTLFSLVSRRNAIMKPAHPYSTEYDKRTLPKPLLEELEKIDKILEDGFVPEPMKAKFSWEPYLFINNYGDVEGIFLDTTAVAAYSPNRIKRRENSDFNFADESYYSVPLEKVKKILNDCKLLGLEYVVIDGSSYGIDLFEPLLKASEKIGVKDIRINGKLMPLWLEHKEGVIALAPRILYEDDAVHHSDELPTLVKYFKSKLSSKIETLIHKDKSINNELISKIKEDDEFAHLNKRTLRKLVSETISKNQKQARE